MALKVYRVEPRSSMVEREALEVLGEPSHRSQATVYTVARSMRAAAERLMETGVNSHAKTSHMELAMGDSLDAILAAGYLHDEHQIVVTSSHNSNIVALWQGPGLYEPVGTLVRNRLGYGYTFVPEES